MGEISLILDTFVHGCKYFTHLQQKWKCFISHLVPKQICQMAYSTTAVLKELIVNYPDSVCVCVYKM
uniref:Uncharacterized protein n=1 Tax=Octopus bimaculoides TaxID=37653 RepID=A0A0L8H456_OCTBM